MDDVSIDNPLQPQGNITVNPMLTLKSKQGVPTYRTKMPDNPMFILKSQQGVPTYHTSKPSTTPRGATPILSLLSFPLSPPSPSPSHMIVRAFPLLALAVKVTRNPRFATSSQEHQFDKGLEPELYCDSGFTRAKMMPMPKGRAKFLPSRAQSSAKARQGEQE